MSRTRKTNTAIELHVHWRPFAAHRSLTPDLREECQRGQRGRENRRDMRQPVQVASGGQAETHHMLGRSITLILASYPVS